MTGMGRTMKDPTAGAPSSIILDCDPGHDDVLALMLAEASDAVDLLAVTTVAGNQSLDKVTRNALSVAALLALEDVPIAAGCDRPLVRPAEFAPGFHGQSGLDGPELPAPTRDADDRHAVDLIIEMVMDREPGSVTLVPTGPLTNIALAARREPRIVDRVRQVVLMGGGVHLGNRTPVAEFNIHADPEAAHIVFGETWPVTMIGLDVTHQAGLTPVVQAQIEAQDTPVSRFVVDLLRFFRTAYHQQQGFDDPPIHDAVAVARVIDPAVVTTRFAPVQVEIRGGITDGMTVTDLRASPPEGCHTQVGTHLDRDGFFSLLVEAVGALGQRRQTA